MARPIDPQALFERVKGFWPQTIVLGAQALQTLNDIYWPLDDQFDDEWLNLGAWAFHQSLWEWVSKAELSDCSLDIDGMTFLVFDRHMRENLADVSWSEDRADYGAMPQAANDS